jgi:uncharacterized protein
LLLNAAIDSLSNLPGKEPFYRAFEMYTKKEQRILLSFLQTAKNPEKAMTPDVLKGFFFGLAVTPEMIMPSEWIPLALGGSAPAVDDRDQARELMEGLLQCIERLSKLQERDKLQYPFKNDVITENKVEEIRQWASGLHLALCLRPHTWLMEESGPLRNQEQDRVINGCGVVCSVAMPERAPEIFPKQAKALENDPRKLEKMLAVLLMLLPGAVEAIQNYGRKKTRERILSQGAGLQDSTGKIGRNDPCPCGSGKKYKKCCGQ